MKTGVAKDRRSGRIEGTKKEGEKNEGENDTNRHVSSVTKYTNNTTKQREVHKQI